MGPAQLRIRSDCPTSTGAMWIFFIIAEQPDIAVVQSALRVNVENQMKSIVALRIVEHAHRLLKERSIA